MICQKVMGMRNIDDVRKNVEDLLMEEFGISPDVRVFAFGGGGGRIASYLADRGISGAKIIAINADEKGLGEINADKKMLLGKDVLGEHKDTAGEVKVAEYIIDRSKAWILEEASSADVIVLLAALGGGMGTGGILETAKILKERTKKPVVAIMVLPFSIEGERRKMAIEAVNRIKEIVTKCIVLDSDTFFKTPNVKVTMAYEIMYERIYDLISKITNITRVEIERKFRELYLSEIDAVVEKVYSEMLVAA